MRHVLGNVKPTYAPRGVFSFEKHLQVSSLSNSRAVLAPSEALATCTSAWARQRPTSWEYVPVVWTVARVLELKWPSGVDLRVNFCFF